MLINSLGCRVVSMSGGVITCVSLVLATLSPNVDVLIVTYGVLGGTSDDVTLRCVLCKCVCLFAKHTVTPQTAINSVGDLEA